MVLRKHPWAITLLHSRVNPGPATLQHHDAVLGSLRTAGFTVALAAHAFSLLDSYIYGYALTESSLPFEGPETVAPMAAQMLAAFPVDTYPHLAEMIREHIMVPGYDYANEFELGLDAILDGLSARLLTNNRKQAVKNRRSNNS